MSDRVLPKRLDPIVNVRRVVLELEPYSLEQCESGIKLDQNESPLELPDSFKRRVMERLLATPWRRYPGVRPVEVAKRLAAHAAWQRDGVLVGHGSNSLIATVLAAAVASNERVVIPRPSFSLYASSTRVAGGEPLFVELDEDFGFDVAALETARRESAAPVTFVCSPNNPTGSVLSLAEVARVCNAAPGLVVIDEAYHAFSGTDAATLLPEHPNLVVLRSFSKSAAMAGLRIGYLLAAPELVAQISKVQLPYSIDLTAEIAALELLETPIVAEPIVADTLAARNALIAALAGMPGVKPFPSAANFVLFELRDGDARRVYRNLAEAGVRVRDVTGYHRLERCLRVSVGSDEENATFLAELARQVGSEPEPSRSET